MTVRPSHPRRLQLLILASLVCLGTLSLIAPPAYAQEAPATPTPATSDANSPPGTPETAETAASPDAPQAPADATGSDTDDTEVTQGQAFVQKLVQGGRTMIFLGLVSVFGLAFALERFVRLRRGNIAPVGLADEADRLWKAGNYEAIIALRKKKPSTLAEVLAAMAIHRDTTAADINMITGDIASRDLRRHLSRAYPLAVVATLSPLLGLLGTIVGMIGAFDKVAAAGAMGNASMLGGDISKALITTGVGLGVAVPALALYHYFKSRTTLLGIILEEECSELISAWFVESRKAPRPAATPPATPQATTETTQNPASSGIDTPRKEAPRASESR